MTTKEKQDTFLLIIMLVVVIGTFVLLYKEIEIPAWLVGTIGTITSGLLGIKVNKVNTYE